MGTPEFAVPGLKKLLAHGYHVAAVVTTPDKPAGRGLRLQSSPVKVAAKELSLPVLEPHDLKSDAFYEELKSFDPDIQIVVAFKKLPSRIWQLPPLGTFNLHASLLPQYRGAAPINWAIINGEKQTGLTTFFINDKIDEGNILLHTTIPIHEEMTAGELHDAMLQPGADLIVDTLEGILNGKIIPQKQPVVKEVKSAPKIFKQDCEINWNKSAMEVYNLIRGLSPFPGAFTLFDVDGKITIIKILRATMYLPHDHSFKLEPAELYFNKKKMLIGCADGILSVEQLMPEGKKSMQISEFLNGIINTSKSLKLA